MVNAKVAGIFEMKNHDILTIDIPLVTTKPTVFAPFGCKWVKGLVELLPACICWVNVIAELIECHEVTWGVMATSNYGNLHPGSRMVLQNVFAHIFRIPSRTVIGNVKPAEIVPNLKEMRSFL